MTAIQQLVMTAEQLGLSEQEQDHLVAFTGERSEWTMCVMAERMHDEDQNATREHKYARSHPYITGMHYVLQQVRKLGECRALDIGSPLAQNVALACMPGVDVTVLDVRPHEDAEAMGLKWQLGTATALPYPDASWDVVISMWVMGHVGDGRYGDAFDVNGDRKMLAEVARVLKPGGIAIIGPGLIDVQCGNIFNLHRIYSWPWLLEEFERVGLAVIERRDLHVSDEVFLDADGDELLIRRRDGKYGVALVTK